MGCPKSSSPFLPSVPLEVASSLVVNVLTCWHLVLYISGNGIPVAVVKYPPAPAKFSVMPFPPHSCENSIVFITVVVFTLS